MTQTESAATESPVGKWKAYPVYKDSGVEWLGEIPIHWEVERLKFNSYIKGRIGWQNLRSDEFTHTGPYLITGMHFKQGSIDWDVCYHITEERYEMAPEIQVKEHDVLITKDGSIGKIAYIENLPGKASLNSHLLVVRPLRGRYVPRYVYYLLLSSVFRSYILLNQAGSTFFGISQESVVNFPMMLPTLQEQHNIATFLDHETAMINALIAKKERLIELLQEKRAALISHAVTKGLDPTMPMKDSGVDWLGEIPVHWKYLSVRNLIRDSQLSIQDGNHGELHPKAEDYVSEGIPFIMANNIRHGGIDLTNCKYISMETAESLRIGFAISGDVLLTHKGTLGETSIVPKMLNYPYIMLTPQVTFYRILKEALFNTFVYFYFQSKFFQKQMYLIASNQSTRDYVGLVAQKDLIIVLPPISEQKAIVTFLNSETVKIDALISRIRDGIEKLKEYSTALVSAAVTGKIDVRGEITSMDDIRH